MKFDGIGPKDFFAGLVNKVTKGEADARRGIEETSPGAKFKPDPGEVFVSRDGRENLRSLAAKVQIPERPKLSKRTISTGRSDRAFQQMFKSVGDRFDSAA